VRVMCAGLSEAGLVVVSLPTVYATRMWTLSMPNSLNFAFSYYHFLVVFASLYVVGLPFMMYHMMRQRRRLYASSGSGASASGASAKKTQ
jgi:hypothetical protein